MKIFAILPLASLALAEAGSIYERQVATIVSAINNINTDTANLNKAVQAFNGPADVQSLQTASDKVAQTVTQSAAQVNQASSITLTDAVQLQSQVQTLQTTIQTTVQNLVAKKTALVAAGAGPTVTQSLNAQLHGANQLSAAITSKVPASVQSLAMQLSAGISTALMTGVTAFADQAQGGTTVGATMPSGRATTTAGRVSASASRGVATATSSRRPSMFTGAAAPKAVARRLAGVAGVVAFML
jgi:hypothetical protein